jgi:hypothetical protein
MKIPAPKGVITVFGDQQEARNIEKGHTLGQANVYQLKTAGERKEPYEEAKRDKEKIDIAADGETKKVYLDDMPDRVVTIGAHLNPEEEKELIQFLNKNKDVFAWSAKDLQGVDRDIIEHALETDERIPPKKQKLRKMSEEKVKAVEAGVQRLQDAKVIRKVKYLVWLANTVPVKKKNGKWRMCVDFTDLNKACKKDDFPLERVDKIVDDAANSEMLSLLDMLSGQRTTRRSRQASRGEQLRPVTRRLRRPNNTAPLQCVLTDSDARGHPSDKALVDGRLSYQSSYGFASRQIPRRSQGTLLPSSGEPKVSNLWNNVQCKDSI